jgi:hypothetical protein
MKPGVELQADERDVRQSNLRKGSLKHDETHSQIARKV